MDMPTANKALKNLADSMKNFFPSNALLGRNGGDEFCIFLPNCTYDDAEEQLEQFTKFQGYFHAMERNINFIFRSDMLNIQPLLQTVLSSCAVQMLLFMR